MELTKIPPTAELKTFTSICKSIKSTRCRNGVMRACLLSCPIRYGSYFAKNLSVCLFVSLSSYLSVIIFHSNFSFVCDRLFCFLLYFLFGQRPRSFLSRFLRFSISSLGSIPNRGRTAVEWGEIPYVHPSIRPPQGQRAWPVG